MSQPPSPSPPLLYPPSFLGAGAGGSSAAFWLSKAFPSTGDISVNTTIFEAANYVGGRSTIIPIKDDPELGVVELGASVFVDVNWNMMNATKRFGLELKDLGSVKSTIGECEGFAILFGSLFHFISGFLLTAKSFVQSRCLEWPKIYFSRNWKFLVGYG